MSDTISDMVEGTCCSRFDKIDVLVCNAATNLAEACVFGVPNERLGGAVGAAIVFHPGIAETEDDLRRHAAGLIAAFKVPRHVWIMDAPLPRNTTGKFMRRELRAALSARVAGA